MEIIRLYIWRILIGVILPVFLAGLAVPFCPDLISQIVTGLVGGITAYLTWISILDLDKSQKNNELTLRLRSNLEGARNGNKEQYIELISMNRDQLSSLEDMVLQESLIGIQNNWKKITIEPRSECLIQTVTNKRICFSIELEYHKLKFVDVWGNSFSRRIIVINDIVFQSHKYLIKELYYITQSDNNIDYAIWAARAICELTGYAPYKPQTGYGHNTEDNFFYDIPKFKVMKQWWETEGVIIEEYKCPFEEVINNSKNTSCFDSLGDNSEERITKLRSILLRYPLLSRTKAELAYLLLDEINHIDEVISLSQESISLCESELLPYLNLICISKFTGANKYIDEYAEGLRYSLGCNTLSEYLIANGKFKLHSDFIREFCDCILSEK